MRSQSYVQSQTYRTIPVQIQANSILNMSVVELQQFIESEAAENPAMTLKESCRCPVCGFLTAGKSCPICKSSLRRVSDASDLGGERDYLRRAYASAGSDGFFDPFRTVASAFNIKDYLRQQIGMTLNGRKLRVAHYIIDSLDDDGYFRESLFETSEEMASHVVEIEEVLRIIQKCDPPGIAARDLQECMILQIDLLGDNEADLSAVSRRVVAKCWDDFSKMKLKAIAVTLGLDISEIVDAIEYMREVLNPYPASSYRDPNESMSPADSNALVPDVLIRDQDGVMIAEVADTFESVIGTDETYQHIYADIKEQDKTICDDDRKHVREHVERVRFIMEAIQLRKKTLVRISQYLADFQENYVRSGPAHLKPIRQKDVAEEMEIHESTVSRALAGKYCRLPSGEVISFEVFFDSALPAKDMISRIVSDSKEPLSDGDIARKLAEIGINIARRTVAKYREQMKMLPVQLRCF